MVQVVDLQTARQVARSYVSDNPRLCVDDEIWNYLLHRKVGRPREHQGPRWRPVGGLPFVSRQIDGRTRSLTEPMKICEAQSIAIVYANWGTSKTSPIWAQTPDHCIQTFDSLGNQKQVMRKLRGSSNVGCEGSTTKKTLIFMGVSS